MQDAEIPAEFLRSPAICLASLSCEEELELGAVGSSDRRKLTLRLQKPHTLDPLVLPEVRSLGRQDPDSWFRVQVLLGSKRTSHIQDCLPRPKRANRVSVKN